MIIRNYSAYQIAGYSGFTEVRERKSSQFAPDFSDFPQKARCNPEKSRLSSYDNSLLREKKKCDVFWFLVVTVR